MSDDERSDLLEIRLFLEKAIPYIEQQLIEYPLNNSNEDHQFLIDKAVMYRETLKRVNQQLKSDEKL